MESLILKLQHDVAARKRPRGEVIPTARVAALLAVALLSAYQLGARSADASTGWTLGSFTKERLIATTAEVETLQGRLAIQQAQIEQLQRAVERSAKYGISADLATLIEEVALAEGIDANLAFDIVRVESNFNPRAVSAVGAIGLAQVMPATAEILSPGITRSELFDRETNLRLGFRFFRSLLEYYKGDTRLALLAYNRGPVTVDRLLAAGIDPGNGYAQKVLGN